MQCFLLNIAPWTKIDHRTGVAMDASFDSPKKKQHFIELPGFQSKGNGIQVNYLLGPPLASLGIV